MLVLISPAKTLDFESPVKTRSFTQPAFLAESEELIAGLRTLTAEEIASLMSVSTAIGELNSQRFGQWSLPFHRSNARQALFAFKGDVYVGLDAAALSSDDIRFAQRHLRILSGLYGLLKPLDLIQPYRLEMGTALSTSRGRSLYDFWGDKITSALNDELACQRKPILVNLASVEYFRAVHPALLRATVINPVFKDYKNGQYKIISFFAKRARGLMSAYIIRNRLSKPEDLLQFTGDGYFYSEAQSSEHHPVFLRKGVT